MGVKIKILQVCNSYLPYRGGIETHVASISERLAREHDVTVFTTDPSGDLPEEEEVNGVLVRRFGAFSPGNAYYLSLDMWAELRNSRFDIVHGHNYHAFPLFFSRYADKTRFVVTPHYHRHGTTGFRDLLVKLYKPFGKKIFQEADRVIALCRYEKELLTEDFSIENGKIAVIPDGINRADFRGLEKGRGKRNTILCVSRLEEDKGVQYAVRALPLLNDNIRLEIVGSGTYKERLVELVVGLGVSSRVDFYQDLSLMLLSTTKISTW